MKKCVHSLLLAVMLAMPAAIQAENWPNWRGPHYTGYAEAENLPTTWSDTENIHWKTPLPGRGAGTPIIWEDRIFLSAVDEESFELKGMCLDRVSGEVLWQKPLGLTIRVSDRNSPASPSPVTNGEIVVFLFGTGDLAALDFDGNILWKRNLQQEMGEFQIQFGYGSSPLLHDGQLYVQVLQRNEASYGSNAEGPFDSYLLALDPQTGETHWKHIRPSDAVAESLEAYTTPIPFEHEGEEYIIVFGADYVTAHNPSDGEEVWRWGNYNPRKIGHWRIVPSPVAGPGTVFVAAPKREPLFAIQPNGEGKLDDSAVAWQFESFPPDVCTPIYHDGRLYVLDGDRHVMTAIDVASGEVLWQGELESRVVMRASPTLADGKLYCLNEDGRVYVMEAGDEFNLLAEIEMPEEAPVRSTISVSDNQLFMRTAKHLYCIQKPQASSE